MCKTLRISSDLKPVSISEFCQEFCATCVFVMNRLKAKKTLDVYAAFIHESELKRLLILDEYLQLSEKYPVHFYSYLVDLNDLTDQYCDTMN